MYCVVQETPGLSYQIYLEHLSRFIANIPHRTKMNQDVASFRNLDNCHINLLILIHWHRLFLTNFS
jgi:hypothetical protein